MRNSWWSTALRFAAIVLMGLTAAFTVLGGAGTTCVALNPTGYEGKFAGIAPFQWLYLLFVILTVAIGVLGIRATVLLVRGLRGAYGTALGVLIAGVVVGGIHMAASRSLRGGSMPVDMVVYTTLLTLIVFLLLRLPGIWAGVNFEKAGRQGGAGGNAAAIALGAGGLLVLTIQFLMAPTHTIGGVNYADVWHLSLSVLGGAMLLSSAGLAFIPRFLGDGKNRAATATEPGK